MGLSSVLFNVSSSDNADPPHQNNPSIRMHCPFGSWFTQPHSQHESHRTTATSSATRSQDISILLSKREDNRIVSELEQLRVHEGLRAETEQRHYLFFPRIMQQDGVHRSLSPFEDPLTHGRVQVDSEIFCRRVLEDREEPEQRKGTRSAPPSSRAGTSSTTCLSVTLTPSFLPRTRDPSTHVQDDDNDVGMPLDDDDHDYYYIPTVIATTTRPLIDTPSPTIFPTVILPDLHQNVSDSLALTMLPSADTSMIFELDL